MVILFSIFIPYAMKVREMDRRVRCAESLRAIGHALLQYADRNGHDYPRVRFDPVRPGYAAFTGAESPDPFYAGTQVQPNDVTASLWLLARSGLIEPYRFVCPSSGDTPDPMTTGGKWVQPQQRSNFTAGRHLSYSYASPFSTAGRFRLNSDVLPADFAVVADKNPGRDPASAGGADVTAPAYNAPPLQLGRANSANHNRAGQNVLYADGHVQFQKTPYCGFGREWQRDNIYTAHSRSPLPPQSNPAPEVNGVCGTDVGPAWEKDSYLVPAAGE